jgi:hypothetical protein
MAEHGPEAAPLAVQCGVGLAHFPPCRGGRMAAYRTPLRGCAGNRRLAPICWARTGRTLHVPCFFQVGGQFWAGRMVVEASPCGCGQGPQQAGMADCRARGVGVLAGGGLGT